jgi:hypothetical protein
MKSRTRVLVARLKKLEASHNPLPSPSYVVTLSHEEWDLPEADKRRLIAERSGGRPVAIMPEQCADAQEWMNRYDKREAPANHSGIPQGKAGQKGITKHASDPG